MENRLADTDLYHIYTKWNQGAGVFRCFFRSTNFVSLKHYPDFPLSVIDLHADSYVKLYSIIDGYELHNTLFIIDLPGTEAIKAAFLLQRDKALKPVLTFNNILHHFGLVGSKEYISYLVGLGGIIEAVTQKGFVFVLDQSRYGDFDEEILRKSFNNQYEMDDGGLPYMEMLTGLGYEKLVYIYSECIKEDISSYLDYLIEEGFPVVKEVL